MTKSKNPSATVISPIFLLSYPTLVTPEPYMEEGKPIGPPVYTMEMIYDPEDLLNFQVEDKDKGVFVLEDIQKVCVRLAKQKWGADFNVKESVKHGALSWPFKNGDDRVADKGEKADHYRGKKILRAKALSVINDRPNAPRLYYIEDGKDRMIVRGTDAAIQRASQLFYGGAFCSAELNVVAGESGGTGKYITFYMNGVVHERDGDRLGGGSALERFRGIRGGATNYDPTEGMSENLEDEIPF